MNGNQRDIVIIGGGHNGLVTAFYLGKAGHKPLVLERSAQVGGAAVTDEFHPGFRCSTLAHTAGPIRPDIVRDMQLEKHGLRMVTPEVCVTALNPDGRALTLYQDGSRSTQEIAAFSQKDATKYAEFQQSLGKISKVIADALATTPPDIDNPSRGDLWSMLQTGRAIRKLGKKDMFRLLRWGPMAVADLASEYFETELLRAVIAARGIFGTFLGPWSAGSALVLLIRAAGDSHPAGSASFAAGGMGAVTQAMASAAKAAGVEIRTGAEVIEIRVQNGVATGVLLSTGEEIQAKAVISNADPKRTLLKLTDPVHLSPEFVQRLQNYRANGTVAKVNLALSGLPRFTALKNGDLALRGRIHVGNEIDYLERAFDESKYGSCSRQPYLDATIPSLTDPTLAPEGKHVMSVYMQYAPYRLKGDWEQQRKALGQTVVQTLAQYAPNLPELILTHQIITPHDLEEKYGLTGGQIFHGELALDQFFTMRPLLDWARYRTPIENLYLCGSGTHPGAGLTGGSGANAAREIIKSLRKQDFSVIRTIQIEVRRMANMFRYGLISIMASSALAVPQVSSSGRIAQLSKGSVSGQFYVNSELRLRYQLPGGWAVSEKETVASHQFSWVDHPSAKSQQTPDTQCSKNLLLVTKHPEGMTLSGFDPMALMIVIDPACFPEITFPNSPTNHEAIQRAAGQILRHLQTPDDVVRAPARVRAFQNAGRLMLEISRSLSITTREVTLSSRTMIRNVERSVLILPAEGYWIAWIFVSGDDVDMDYLRASKIFFDEPGESSPVK